MSIRLICSDIDGTLLQYGRKELEGEIFEQIRELHRRGILFCPASGRQYTSLRKLFAPVADCCVFLCENGGVIYKDEQCIAKEPDAPCTGRRNRQRPVDPQRRAGRSNALRSEYRLPDGAGLGMPAYPVHRGTTIRSFMPPLRCRRRSASVYLHEGVESYTERFVPRWKEANCADRRIL